MRESCGIFEEADNEGRLEKTNYTIAGRDRGRCSSVSAGLVICICIKKHKFQSYKRLLNIVSRDLNQWEFKIFFSDSSDNRYTIDKLLCKLE